MDGLDALLAEATAERTRKDSDEQTPTKKPAPKPLPAAGARPSQASSAAAVRTPTVSTDRPLPQGTPQCANALKGYIQRLLDPPVLEQIDRDLSKRPFDEVARYAMAHPELARYTVEQELPRMQYEVLPPGGGDEQPLTDPAAIRALHDGGGAATAGDAALVWRLANQSLLADLLQPLQCWMDVDLSVSVRASTCSFVLDLRPGRLSVHARAALSIQTLGAGDAPLELATSEASVRVSFAERACEQSVQKPRLCKCVVFEEQLLGVAAALAQSGAADGMGGGGGGSAGRGGRGGGGGRDDTTSLDDVTRELERFMADDDAPRGVEGEGEQNSCKTS